MIISAVFKMLIIEAIYLLKWVESGGTIGLRERLHISKRRVGAWKLLEVQDWKKWIEMEIPAVIKPQCPAVKD